MRATYGEWSVDGDKKNLSQWKELISLHISQLSKS